MGKSKKPKTDVSLTPEMDTQGFDIGFQLPEVQDVVNQLGTAAIHFEDAEQSIRDQLQAYLNQAQTALAFAQTDLGKQMNDALMQSKEQLNKANQEIEAQYAGHFGGIAEQVSTILPQDQLIKTLIVDPTKPGLPIPPSGPPSALPPGGAFKPGQGTIDAPIAWNPADGKCGLLAALGLPPFVTGTPPGSLTGNQLIYLTAPDGRGYRLAWAYVQSSPGKWTLRCEIKSDLDTSEWFLEPPYECWSGATIPPGGQPPVEQSPSLPPGCPPAVPCPPCQTQPPPATPPSQQCIKICPPDKPDCPEPEYSAYCSYSSGMIYVVKKGVRANSPQDILLASGSIGGFDFNALCKACNKPSTPGYVPEVPLPPPNILGGVGCEDLFFWQSLQTADVTTIVQQLLGYAANGTVGNPLGTIPVVGSSIAGFVNAAVNKLFGFLNRMIGASAGFVEKSACPSLEQKSIVEFRSALSLLSYVTGRSLEGLDTSAQYKQNYNCPYLVPSIPEAIRAFLTDSITLERANCLIRMNGGREDIFGSMIDSTRTRLGPTETTVAYRRGLISLQDADANLRQLGYLYPVERQALYDLTQQIPSISDIIPMMIRDVEDTVNVDWSESDKIFQDKYKGQLQQWGEQNGIAPNFAKYAWRAHWHLPSPTQLFEFYRRLRHTGKYGNPKQFREEIKRVLIQQDILPHYVDYFLDVAFTPLTRIDSRRAFEIGSLNEGGLQRAYYEAGYSDENANILVKYNKKLLRDKWLKNPLIKKYAVGDLSKNEATFLATDAGLPDYMVPEFQTRMEFFSKAERRKKCVKSYRRRFMIGEITAQDAIELLIGQELDAPQAQQLVAGWQCERDARGKEIPAAKLIDYFMLGVIDQVELYRRLINLGYTTDDAALIQQEARVRLSIRTSAEQARQVAKIRRETAANERLQRQLAAQAQASLEKLQRKGESMQRLREKRQRLLIEAGDKWSKAADIPLADATVKIGQVIKTFIAAGISSIDSIYTAAVEVATQPLVLTQDDFSRAMGELLYAIEA